VVGLYDKGKTFVLNQITNSNLPSGKKITTKGLSFKVCSDFYRHRAVRAHSADGLLRST
jgi:hypothetical protein